MRIWVIVGLVSLGLTVCGCGRRRDGEPAKASSAPPAKATPKATDSWALLLQRVERDHRIPPALHATDLLTVYDDNRLAGDRNFKGEYVWLQGPLTKLDSRFGQTFLVMTDRVKRSIDIRIFPRQDDRALLALLKQGEIVAVWGRVQGLIDGSIVVQNASLLTKDRREILSAAKK